MLARVKCCAVHPQQHPLTAPSTGCWNALKTSPVKTDSYRPKMPNSKKKLLGSARLGLSLPRLQQAETTPRHSLVAVQRPRPLNPPGSPSNPPSNHRRAQKMRYFSIISLKISINTQIQPPQSILIKGLELAIFTVFRHRYNRQTPPNPQKKTHFFVNPCNKNVYFWF